MATSKFKVGDVAVLKGEYTEVEKVGRAWVKVRMSSSRFDASTGREDTNRGCAEILRTVPEYEALREEAKARVWLRQNGIQLDHNCRVSPQRLRYWVCKGLEDDELGANG